MKVYEMIQPELNMILVKTKIQKDDAIIVELPGGSKHVRAKVTESGLLVQADPINDYTKQIADKEWEVAEVISLSKGFYQNGTLIKPDHVKVGDKIMYLKLTGRTWVDEDENFKYWLMDFLHVMGTVNGIEL